MGDQPGPSSPLRGLGKVFSSTHAQRQVFWPDQSWAWEAQTGQSASLEQPLCFGLTSASNWLSPTPLLGSAAGYWAQMVMPNISIHLAFRLCPLSMARASLCPFSHQTPPLSQP